MIVYLDGTLVAKQPTRIVVDVQGVGYEVFIPLSSFDALPAPGQPCRILTHDHIREDARILYGFGTEAERLMFTRLLDVSGIGPKIALAALSGMSVRELTRAIVDGDAKRLSQISGIGRKTAERMVVDLKDKIGAAEALEAASGRAESEPSDQRLRDALLALVSLGYKQAEALKLLRALQPDLTPELSVEDIIRKSLQR